MKLTYILLSFLLCVQACVKSELDPQEGFLPCIEDTDDFFEPSQKSFILPSKSAFLDTLCHSIGHLGSIFAFPNLDSDKVCLLERNLGGVKSFISEALCGEEVSNVHLDLYKYQYFNVVIDGEKYIFINAFILPDSTDVNWKIDYYHGECNNDYNQWTVLFNLETLEFEEFFYYLPFRVSLIPEFPFDRFCGRCFDCIHAETFALQMKDLCEIESRLSEVESIISEGCHFAGETLYGSYNDYYYQYLGVENEEQRWVYINAFYIDMDSQHYDETISYMHNNLSVGGCHLEKGHWGILFNLDTREFENLQFDSGR